MSLRNQFRWATVSVALAQGGPGSEIRQVKVFENRPEFRGS